MKRIVLNKSERKELEDFCKKGIHNVRFVNRAKIILCMDTSEDREGLTQEETAGRIGVHRQAVATAKRDFLAAQNVAMFLQRKKRQTPPIPPKVTGDVEAHIITLACSKPPAGCSVWTLRLLAEKSIELEYIDSISHTRISTLLKKHNLSLI